MATKKDDLIMITPISIKTVAIRIVGDTPLIVHAWSVKEKKMMLDAQMGKTKTKAKEKKDPFDDFVQSLYWIDGKPEKSTPEAFEKAVKNGAKWGFPVGAFKQAANSAAYRMKWVKTQMELRGSYFIKTQYGDMAEIKGDAPIMREDMVRIGMGTADIRYRGEFRNWYTDCLIEYNENGAMSLEQIINCINAGGYAVGIGEWRPEKDGSNGMFHIEIAD
jgi:hypothetical protein